MNQIQVLARVFAYLSRLTAGGGVAALPEMRILTVEVHKWLTFPQLIHLYSVGQPAPGPNMMMMVAIAGWVGGFVAAVVTLIAFFGPTTLFTFLVARLGKKLENWPWRTSIQQGLAPVSIGLLLAGCFTMGKGAISGLATSAIAVGVLLILLQYRINPALLVVGVAAVDLLSFATK